ADLLGLLAAAMQRRGEQVAAAWAPWLLILPVLVLVPLLALFRGADPAWIVLDGTITLALLFVVVTWISVIVDARAEAAESEASERSKRGLGGLVLVLIFGTAVISLVTPGIKDRVEDYWQITIPKLTPFVLMAAAVFVMVFLVLWQQFKRD